MRERGAALTETVVLIPVLLLGWAGVDYFRAGYTRRMQALSLASHGAWRRSFDPGCAAGASSTQPRAFADLLEPAAGGEFAPLVREAIERYYVGHETLFGLAHVDARVSLGTRQPGWSGAAAATVTAGMFLPCNEPRRAGRDVQPTLGDFLFDRMMH